MTRRLGAAALILLSAAAAAAQGRPATLAVTRASIPLSDTVTVDAGGARVGGGLRFRF